MPDTKQPLQPLYFDKDGVARFRANAIVRWLLDAGPFDMNQIAVLPGITAQDRAQFAALIGYSVSGWGDLDYVSEGASEELEQADQAVDAMVRERDK